jgi:hypothetical protein
MNLLPVGTLVEVAERLHPPRPHLIGVVRGHDDAGTKYEIGRRYLVWSTWRYLNGGTWAAPKDVTELHADDVPTAAGLCNDCGVPIILGPEGSWEHTGDPADLRPGRRRRARRRLNTLHPTVPAPCTVELASVWDYDTAEDRKYPATDIPLTA